MVDTLSRFRIHSCVLAQNRCSLPTALFVWKLKPENIKAVFIFFACALANRVASTPATLAIVLDWSQLNRVDLSPSALNQSAQISQQNIIYLTILVIKGLAKALSGHLRRIFAASRDDVGAKPFCVAPIWVKQQTNTLVRRAISLCHPVGLPFYQPY